MINIYQINILLLLNYNKKEIGNTIVMEFMDYITYLSNLFSL